MIWLGLIKKQSHFQLKQHTLLADNIEHILAKAAQSARSVSTEAGYLTEDTKEQVLQKAHGQAQGVASKAKDYTPA